MFTPILIIFSLVALSLLGVVTLHLVAAALLRACGKGKSLVLLSLIQAVLFAIGLIGLWGGMDSLIASREFVRPLPQSLKIGALALYLAGCVVYVETRSLVSRGYSLRILVDLLANGGSASVGGLKSGYGDGVGVEGMLAKRLGTLERLHLVRFQGNQVGPLTTLGKIFTIVSLRFRRLLGLEMVG